MLVTIHHRKGGVGKTTTTQCVATAAAMNGKRTLVIDCDGQGNCTAGFDVRYPKKGIADALRAAMKDRAKPWKDCIISIADNLELVPSTPDSYLVEDEITFFNGVRAGLLKQIKHHLDDYDLIICDTAPSAGWLADNALLAADRIIAPVICETYAVEGLNGLNRSLTQLGKQNNVDKSPLRLSALVPTMVHGARGGHRDLLALLRKQFKGIITKTMIRTDANIETAQYSNQNIFDFAPRSRAAHDYAALVKELFSHG